MDKITRPVAIRAQFGQNLRLLCAGYPSVSEVCRQLGINRAQFNRYLNGESYPRPDMLARICDFFETDARILIKPLEDIAQVKPDLLSHPEIRDFTAPETTRISEDTLPNGFYRFTRQSFLFPERYILGLVFLYRKDGWTFLKGSEARQSLREQGLSNEPFVRQFKGYAQKVEDGINIVVSRRNAMTYTNSFITRVASFDRNFWQGYSTRTVNEAINTVRATRLAYEFLGGSTKLILETARNTGFCEPENLPPYHQRLLRIGEPFY
jgi:transcriptional regulator with XRE-family HTH domain